MKRYKPLFEKDENINLQQEYEKWNKILFKNELPNISIVWDNSKVSGGQLIVRGIPNNPQTFQIIKMQISKFMDRTYEQFSSILIHEMCHVWVIEQRLPVFDGEHGDIFQDIRKDVNQKLKRLKLNIQVENTEDITGQKVSSNIKNKEFLVVLIFDKEENKYGIMTYSPKVQKEIIKKYKDVFDDSDYEISFVVSDNRELLKYPIKQKFNTERFKIDKTFFDELKKEKEIK